MPRSYYPAILYPADSHGLHGVTVPGINVNGQGSDAQAALADAALILQEVIDDLLAEGDSLPDPLDPSTIDAEDGAIVMLPATLPGKSVRINVTMDEELIRRIDAVASNRSGFLARAAQAMLAAA
jgi:predicted RNase H-like HicB family nuclease